MEMRAHGHHHFNIVDDISLDGSDSTDESRSSGGVMMGGLDGL